MSIDKLQVRLDANNILPRSLTPAINEHINIADTWERAQIKEGVWCDPYSGMMMITPLQLLPDASLNADIERNGKSMWALDATGAALGTHWDEQTVDQEKWLISDGTTEKIRTTRIFGKNAGFVLQIVPFGADNDRFDVIDCWFGKWKLRLDSAGGVILTLIDDSGETTVELEKARGNISGGNHQSLNTRVVELLILPSPRGDLFIRRNGVAGFWYRMPINTLFERTVIDSNHFAIKALTGKIRFQLTQLRYPTEATGYHYVTPNFTFPRTPVSTQTVSVEVDNDIPESGGFVAALNQPLSAGQGFDDLAGFIYDGSANQYCVSISLLGSTDHNTSPMLFGVKLSSNQGTGGAITPPDAITHDITSMRMHTGDNVSDTYADITIRNPGSHPIYGACNRLCTVTAGSQTVFIGVLAEPPEYDNTNGIGIYHLKVSSLAKYLSDSALYGSYQFDLMSHTDAVKQLCYAAQLLDSDIETDADTTPLPDTRTVGSNGEANSELTTEYGDSSLDWIERICDLTGWQFTDGYLASGDFGFRYIDPFSMDDSTVKAYFVFDSADETDDYQRIRAWNASSLEPECNEFIVCARDINGQVIAGRYRDVQSQDPATLVESRPDNWLGTTRIVIASLDYTADPEWLKGIALKLGSMLSKRRDIVSFEGDYPIGLWKNDIIQIYDSSGTMPGINGISQYRIIGIPDISFINEADDIPLRRARYEAIKIRDVII